MNKTIAIVTVSIVALVGAFALTPKAECDATTNNCQNETAAVYAPKDAVRIQDEVKADRAILIDVRELSEYESGYAKGAINIPLGQIESGNLEEDDKGKPVYLYCRSGRRADIAKSALEEQGYTNVTNLGGLVDWRAQGGGIVQ